MPLLWHGTPALRAPVQQQVKDTLISPDRQRHECCCSSLREEAGRGIKADTRLE